MKGGGINALPRGEEPSLETLVFHSVCHASFLPRPVRSLIGHSPLFSFCISSHSLCSFALEPTSRPVSFGFVCVPRLCSVLCLFLLSYILPLSFCMFVAICVSIQHHICVNLSLPPLSRLSFASCKEKCELLYIFIVRHVGQAMKRTAGLKVL